MSARPSAFGGFTLLEVVVAAGVTAAVAALLLAIVVQVGEFTSQSSGRLLAANQARRMLDQLEADFQSIVIRRTGDAWMIVTIQPDQPAAFGHAGMPGETWIASAGGVVKPRAAEGSLSPWDAPREAQRFGQAGVWLRFVTARREPGGTAARPAAVSYQIVRRRPQPAAAPAYQLYRARASTAATFAAGYDLGEGSLYHAADDTIQAPGNLRRPPGNALLGNHVIDFGVRLFTLTAAGEEELLFPTAANPLEHREQGLRPRAVLAEVYVRILIGDGARQMALLEEPPASGGFGADWWEQAERHSELFIRRIPILAHPL